MTSASADRNGSVGGDGNGAVAVLGPGSASGSPAPAQGWMVPLVVLIVGSFMSVLDTSIVNVAISRIQNEFGATTEDVQWVANGYTLTLGVVVPLSAWLSDRFGLSRLYVVSLLGFGALVLDLSQTSLFDRDDRLIYLGNIYGELNGTSH